MRCDNCGAPSVGDVFKSGLTPPGWTRRKKRKCNCLMLCRKCRDAALSLAPRAAP